MAKNDYDNPYHRVGLRRNPFLARQDLYLNGDRWCDFGYSVPSLTNSPQFIQFLGVKGAGKTAHLRRWQQATGGIYYYHHPWDWHTLPPAIPDPHGVKIIYWDEANRIPLPFLLWSLHRARHHQLTVVVGSHLNLAAIARLIGFPVQTYLLQSLTLPQLNHWITRQFQAESLPRRSPTQIAAFKQLQQQLTEPVLTDIIQHSNGSWRQAGSLLHRWLAQQLLLAPFINPDLWDA
ncbi:MAG: hypothetical protein ACO36E_06085 [Synechocystis sp.]